MDVSARYANGMVREIRSLRKGPLLEYPKFLFCGSFNPIHAGHISIVNFIFRKFHTPVDLEISCFNVEKQAINPDEAFRRWVNIKADCKGSPAFNRLYVTDDARYLEKARYFPDVTFVCGFDTMKVLAEGKYYSDFQAAIDEFDDLGIKWLAFPRKDITIDFDRVPVKLSKNITVVSKEDFPLIDMASRDLRK